MPMIALWINQIKPDIIHVFQSSRKRSFFSSYPFLSDLIDLQKRPLKVYSVFNLPESQKIPTLIGHSCAKSDLVLTQTPSIFNHLSKSLYMLNQQSPRKIHFVPLSTPPIIPTENQVFDLTDVIAERISIILPCSVSDLIRPRETMTIIRQALRLNSNLNFIFTGDWGTYSPYQRNIFWKQAIKENVAHRLRFLGFKRQDQWTLTNGNNCLFWLSPISASQCDLLQKFRLSIETDALPLLLNIRDIFPYLCEESIEKEIHCGNSLEDLLLAVERHDKSRAQRNRVIQQLRNLQNRELIDQPANIIHRLYFQFLANPT